VTRPMAGPLEHRALFPQRMDQHWGPLAILGNTRIIFQGVEQSEREADRSVPSISEVKNAYSCASIHHIPSCLKNRENCSLC
jgi:hypothetical protein